jgi:hypothetical protein
MKTKTQYPCPLCACDKTRTLSDEAAVEIHEFLETITANFLNRYGHRIQRHYTRRIRKNINVQQPWKNLPDLF